MATKICKVCGKEYEYCHTQRRTPGIFRYQDVACCAEHGSIYLARVIAARSTDNESKEKAKEEPKDKAVDEVVKIPTVSVSDYDDVDEDDEEWFEDDEEDEYDEEDEDA